MYNTPNKNIEKFIAYYITVYKEFRFNNTLKFTFKWIIYLENILKYLKLSLQVVVSPVNDRTTLSLKY